MPEKGYDDSLVGKVGLTSVVSSFLFCQVVIGPCRLMQLDKNAYNFQVLTYP